METISSSEEGKISWQRCIYNNLIEFFLYIPNKNNLQNSEEARTQNYNIEMNIESVPSTTHRNLSSIYRNFANANKIHSTDIWNFVAKKGIEIKKSSENQMESIFKQYGVIYIKNNIVKSLKGIASMKKNNMTKIGFITFILMMNILLIICLMQNIIDTPFDFNFAFSILVLIIWFTVTFFHIFEIILLVKKYVIENCFLKLLFLLVFLINNGISIAFIKFIQNLSPQIFSYSLILLLGYNIIWILYVIIISLISFILLLLQFFLFILYFFVFLPYKYCCSKNAKSALCRDSQEKGSKLCPICLTILETKEQKIARINMLIQP